MTQFYAGIRGDKFHEFVRGILSMGKLKPAYQDALFKPENIELLNMAFTSLEFDTTNNYEMFEQMGDMTINKFIVMYTHRKFKHLNNAEGVKLVARVRILHGSKEKLCKIAETLGFWDYISCSTVQREKMKKDMLEDVFEAFFGAIEYILDLEFRNGVGYSISYDILEKIYDTHVQISLKLEDLFDSITRLKEYFDKSSNDFVYVKEHNQEVSNMICVAVFAGNKDVISKLRAYSCNDTNDIRNFPAMHMVIAIGRGHGHTKKIASQNAANSAIKSQISWDAELRGCNRRF